jgi:DNA-binding LytR/AlgR family response regulator
MEKFNCLIVEDEPLAAEVMQDYISQVPFLICTGVCRDAIYAMEILHSEKVDVLFLDIHLPKLKGLDFIRTLKNPPQIIITTAYREYALDGYELNILDYLLKPIQFSRFLTAVNKIKSSSTANAPDKLVFKNAESKSYLLVNVNKKTVKIQFDNILYIESRKEYISIVTKDKSFATKYQLGEIEQQLDMNKFLRIHRSFIVAREKITAFGAADVELDTIQIPVGRSYKEFVLTALQKNSV